MYSVHFYPFKFLEKYFIELIEEKNFFYRSKILFRIDQEDWSDEMTFLLRKIW